MIEFIPYILILLFTGYICYGFLLLTQNFFLKAADKIGLAFSGKMLQRHDDLEKHLLHRFSYYDRLPQPMKIKFLLRVKSFIRSKAFEGREGLEVTDEMKVWVAAAAVQLTFGLSKYSLARFSKIILYPQAFYNRQNDALHMGEVNMRGIIVLSWKDLQEGYHEANDNFNVGLHEMAHALELQMLLKDDYDIFFGNYYPKWSIIAAEEFENVGNERSSYLRKYAGTNKREFFAVCIEYFFESGAEFRKQLPEIYYHLCILLNQNPLHNDAHVEEARRKTQEELEFEITSQAPVLTPGYSFEDITFQALYFILMFTTFFIAGIKGNTIVLYYLGILTAAAIISLYFRMNKLILYENYLAVNNPFGKTKTIYELNDIVAVKINNNRSGESLRVVRARNGKIIRNNHPYLAKGSDIELLLSKLKEKKIAVS